MNIVSIYRKFPTEESCIKYLEEKRWNGKAQCPYCKSNKTSKHNQQHTRVNWQCQECKKSFSVTVNTIFHHTHLPLQKWFLAISLILNAKKGLSTRQLARDLELPVKTAWSLGMRIRMAFKTEQAELLKGIFEMDETYVKVQKEDDKDDKGGFGGGRSTKNKTPVVAFKEKNGNLKAFVTNDTTSATLSEIIINHIHTGSELHTDEYNAYKFTRQFWKHRTVNHSVEYVSSEGVHCNSIEGFWGMLKRGIKGNFHWLSKKYLQDYVTEFEFRYNNRKNEFVFGDVLNRLLLV